MGPASSWAASAAVGDELIVIGPDRRSEQVSGGIEWNPGTAREVMLAGDETAAPAICAILESLAASDEARVFFGEAYIEVPTADDVLEVNPPSGVVVRWLPRDGAPLGELLGPAVQDWGRRRSIIFEARRAAWAPGLSPSGRLLRRRTTGSCLLRTPCGRSPSLRGSASTRGWPASPASSPDCAAPGEGDRPLRGRSRSWAIGSRVAPARDRTSGVQAARARSRKSSRIVTTVSTRSSPSTSSGPFGA